MHPCAYIATMDPRIKAVLILLCLFIGPLLLVVAFVAQRNQKRRIVQARSWGAVAVHYGGTFIKGSGLFGGHRLVFDRPYGRITIETQMVSVVDAIRSPYHNDGGTFAHARAAFAGGRGPTFDA